MTKLRTPHDAARGVVVGSKCRTGMEVDHPYQIIPAALRNTIQDTLLCCTVAWIMTLNRDVDVEKACSAMMDLRFGHVHDNPGSDPLTGYFEVNGIRLEMDYDHFRLMKLWGTIRSDMLRHRKRCPDNPYLFSPSITRNKYSRKTIVKALARWVTDCDKHPPLRDCGVFQPPHLNDAQRMYVVRGGEVRDLALIDTFLLALSIQLEHEESKVKAVLFGSTAKYGKNSFIPSLQDYGVDVTKHYPTGKARTPTLDPGTDLVLIIQEWTPAPEKDAAIALAREAGIPFLLVSRKTALVIRALKAHDFIGEDVEAEPEEIEAAMEDQVEAGAALLLENPDASEQEFAAWVEEKTTCPPIDDSVMNRAKAVAAARREPPPPAPEPEPEPEPLPPEPEEPVAQPAVQLPPDDHVDRWERWSRQRLDVLEEVGEEFLWGGETYRVARCPKLETTSGDTNRDEGRLIVALWGDERVLVARRDRNVHQAARAFMLSRGDEVEDGELNSAMTLEVRPSEVPVGIGNEAELYEEGDEEPRGAPVVPLELVPMEDCRDLDIAEETETLLEEPEETPVPVVVEHPYARFERLRGEMIAVMEELGFAAVTVMADGTFNIKGSIGE